MGSSDDFDDFEEAVTPVSEAADADEYVDTLPAVEPPVARGGGVDGDAADAAANLAAASAAPPLRALAVAADGAAAATPATTAAAAAAAAAAGDDDDDDDDGFGDFDEAAPAAAPEAAAAPAPPAAAPAAAEPAAAAAAAQEAPALAAAAAPDITRLRGRAFLEAVLDAWEVSGALNGRLPSSAQCVRSQTLPAQQRRSTGTAGRRRLLPFVMFVTCVLRLLKEPDAALEMAS